jgi:transposase InsO family protein
MGRRAIDTIGIFPEDEEGNGRIISITDTFSRFNCLYPVPERTAETAVKRTLIPHIGIFRVPEQLLSDNRANFANTTVAELAKGAGFEQILTTPGSHQENSMEEQNHKESTRHPRGLLFEAEGMMQWSMIAPSAQRIVNA